MSRMPERDIRGQKESRFSLSNTQWGLLLIVLMVAGSYLAFTKHIPFAGHGYELSATFKNSVNIRTKSPVRIAGVTVGEVLSVQRGGDYSTVNFTVSEAGRPVREDAFVAIRPRMFLEGNFFVDLKPGSPSAPELDDGSTIPVTRTSTAVQFDEILSALQSDTRKQLGRLLIGYGKALNHQPTPAEDRTQDPEVHGKSGAEALNMAFDYGPRAARGSAEVLEAFRGTEQGEQKLHEPGGPEAAMGEVTVIEGGDGEHPQQVRSGADGNRDRADADPQYPQAGDVQQQERGDAPAVETRRRLLCADGLRAG